MLDKTKPLTDELLKRFAKGTCLVKNANANSSRKGRLSSLHLDGTGPGEEVKILAEFEHLTGNDGGGPFDLGKMDMRLTVREIILLTNHYLHFHGEGENVMIVKNGGNQKRA